MHKAPVKGGTVCNHNSKTASILNTKGTDKINIKRTPIFDVNRDNLYAESLSPFPKRRFTSGEVALDSAFVRLHACIDN